VKVDSTNNSSVSAPKGGVQGARSQGSGAAASGAAKAPAPNPGGDANVNLSGLSSQLRTLAASGSADIDVAQVESIKQAIKEGTLSIDTSKIADGIIETARNLLQKPSSGS
jgi:negative regulator of flagellin synthesis FlgM